MIPKEYGTEAEHVIAHGRMIGFESMGKWRAEMRSVGFHAGAEPDPECWQCNERIKSKHILLKSRGDGPDVRLHARCFRNEVGRVSRILFAKGRKALSGKYRGWG